MKTNCPGCGAPIPLSQIERWQPFISKTYAFECAKCRVALLIDYSEGKVNLFRALFVVGAIAIIVGVPKLGAPLLITISVVAVYVVLGWIVLRKIRRIRFADTRIHEQQRQNSA